jgi:adenosylcobyric acid synthase
LNANTVLVADIDRGGVFAHIVGTLELLEPAERALIKGFIINKFRGQKSLLDSGITWLEERTGIPVLGVVPMLDSVFPAEDSLDLLERRSRKPNAELNIGIVKFPRIANFTDFDPLDGEPTVNIEYITRAEQIDRLDAIILPGSKTTIADLTWMKDNGIFDRTIAYHANGGTVMGICGGFQMLGKTINDPDGIEGVTGIHTGLNLLPIDTTIECTKIVQRRSTYSNLPALGQTELNGYEIHQGISNYQFDNPELNGYNYLTTDRSLGIVDRHFTTWGTYLHGILDNGIWRRYWLNTIRAKHNLSPLTTAVIDYQIERDRLFDNLADEIERYIDLSPLID